MIAYYSLLRQSDSIVANMDARIDYDVLVVGAGMSGIYALYKLRSLGFRVRVIEAGPEVGGTWYWNRYPGARFDSESYTYGFSFSQELLDEWDWSEHFAAQPETERYINYVCDKFDLRKDIKFDTRIRTARFRAQSRSWQLYSEEGEVFTSRFLVTAMGILTSPTLPNIRGIESYKGKHMHTSRWPHEQVSFTGKRVGIIGTGATGIQTIQEVAKTAQHLTVFQRTPNWTIPARNEKISKEEMRQIRKEYPNLFAKCWDNPNCFVHMPSTDKTTDFTAEERQNRWEELYNKRGFAVWLSNYKDTFVDSEANAKITEFMSQKVRQRVKDPKTAEKLIPKNHGFGTRRVPLETKYYEVYNQNNVELVDVNETPISQVTETGINTTTSSYDFDIIIYATGFDAITGAFDAMDFEGTNGMKLKKRWQEGPRTFLGMLVQGFPNMTMIMGPHQAFGNIPRSIEYAVGWIADLLCYCRDNGITYFETKPEAVEWWTKHVKDAGKDLLMNKVDSWMTGVNKNLAHKQERQVTRYAAGAPTFRKHCNQVAAGGYQELRIG